MKKTDQNRLARNLPYSVRLHVVEQEESELNLIWGTVDEALHRTDQFLDQVFVSPLQEVRIIHGFGTGKLRTTLNDFLSHHPHVLRHLVEGATTAVALRP